MNNKNINPNLFVPGAGKSGTSSLHEYLNQHPDIFMSPVKEPHFFSKHYNEMDLKNSWGKYLDLFKEGATKKYLGESSTGYMVFPNVIERIKKNIVNPKFIFLLRNPIDRAFSHYNWVKSFGKENNSFREAILFDKNDDPNPLNSFGQGYKYYFQFGLYYKWLNRFYDNFDEKQLYIITTETLKANTLDALNECYSFLRLPLVNSYDLIVINKTKYYSNPTTFIKIKYFLSLSWIPVNLRKSFPGPIRNISKNLKKRLISETEKNFLTDNSPYLNKDERNWLRELYKNDVENLMKLTKKDFSEWKDFNESELKTDS